MNDDTDRTDVIPGLRPDLTPAMPLLLPGTHRRQRRTVPWWGWVAIWGAPAAVAAGLVGWSLGGPPHHKAPTAVVSSPSESAPAAEAPVSLPPTTTAPAPRFSVTRSAAAPAPTTKPTRRPSPTVSASPSPRHTHSSPAPSPTRTREEPSPSPTDTDAPPTFTPPTITPEATPHG